MYERIKIIYKKCGQTPLECINEVKKSNPELLCLPLTYAGRLDPLAEGVLIILAGDECLKKDEYLKLSKEYEVDILFGYATDTYDVMGKVVRQETPSEVLFKRSSDEGDGSQCQTILNSASDFVSNHKNGYDNFTPKIQVESKELFKMVWPSFQRNLARKSEDLLNESFDETAKQIKKILSKFTGKIKQAYPPYSSRPVNGKPLFMWARDGKLNEIEIPTHDVFVENIEIIKEGMISGRNFLDKIKSDISKVKGDFRQEEIIKLWESNLEDKSDTKFKTITVRISCGSGVYVRGIAHELGKMMGVPALALKIVRTKVGEYRVNKD